MKRILATSLVLFTAFTAMGQTNIFKDVGRSTEQKADWGSLIPDDPVETASPAPEYHSKSAQEWLDEALQYYEDEEYSKAITGFRVAANNNIVEAQYMLGVCYYSGAGIQESLSQAAYWWKRAADQGDSISCCLIGMLYFSGAIEREPNYTKAIEYLLVAANKDVATSYIYLGKCYYYKREYYDALRWLEAASDNDDPEACRYLWRMYYYGHGTDVNYAKVVRYINDDLGNNEEAASDPELDFVMGTCYINGYYVTKDISKGLSLWEEAADLGWEDKESMFLLGESYRNGTGVSENKYKAFRWYSKASELRHVDARVRLAYCYLMGEGTSEDYEKAWELLDQAVYVDDPDSKYIGEAKYLLGTMFRDGKYVLQNEYQEEDWYEKAAANGYAEAMYQLGKRRYSEEKYDAAMSWFAKGAELDHTGSQYQLALYNYEQKNISVARKWFARAADLGDTESQYMYGIIVFPENGKESMKYIQKAADKGHAKSECMMGKFYHFGYGETPVDYAKAKLWYERAAAKDDPQAINLLGLIYYNGSSEVAQNRKMAIEFFEKSSNMGFAAAQGNLAYCYYYGIEVDRDYKKAYALSQQSADENNEGNYFGKYILGMCYYYGNGVKKDKPRGLVWLNKAKDSGSEDAQKLLDEINGVDTSQSPMENTTAMASASTSSSETASDAAPEQTKSAMDWLTEGLQGKNEGNPQKEFDCYYKAAELGSPIAQTFVGNRYFYGDGVVAQDKALGIEWYTKAAEQDFVDALKAMSRCYQNGDGVEKDEELAQKWRERAANLNDLNSQYNSAVYYFNIKNRTKAKYWAEKAAARGMAKAQSLLEDINSELGID